MNINECAQFMSDNIPGAANIYAKHLNDYGCVLLHVLAGDIIDKPLEELLESGIKKDLIGTYCGVIEEMWRSGDEYVKNVVDATILEYFSTSDVWQAFGTYISDDMKNYINNEFYPQWVKQFKIEQLM